MLSKLKLMVVGVFAIMLPMALISAVPVTAQTETIADKVCKGSQQSDSGTCATGTTGTNTLYNVATKVIDLFSIVVGIAAVIMIIFGGFKYITSGGDSGAIGSAKNTVMYAMIGLVVVVIAQFIVNFVITEASTAVTGETL